jgi:hypothetical protein
MPPAPLQCRGLNVDIRMQQQTRQLQASEIPLLKGDTFLVLIINCKYYEKC